MSVNCKKLSTMQKRKNRKNRVIHEVIHIIHRKVGKNLVYIVK